MAPEAFFFLILIWATSSVQSDDPEYDTAHAQDQILHCVDSVHTVANTGFISVTDKSLAFPLLIGQTKYYSNSTNSFCIAAGFRRKGRIVGIGHEDFFIQEPESDRVSDRATFLDNLFLWLSNGNMTNIALLPSQEYEYLGMMEEVQAEFRGRFKQVQWVRSNESDIRDEVLAANVVLVLRDIDPARVGMINDFAIFGGGLAIATINWWHMERFENAEDFREKFWLNILVGRAGFFFDYNRFHVGMNFVLPNILKSAVPEEDYKCDVPKTTSPTPQPSTAPAPSTAPPPSSTPAPSDRTDQQTILRCVEAISLELKLGLIKITNESTAFPLMTGPKTSDSETNEPVIAASRLEKGRIVAISNADFLLLLPDSKKYGHSRKIFLANLFDWVSNSDTPRVLVLAGKNKTNQVKDMENLFSARFTSVSSLALEDMPPDLAPIDVVICIATEGFEDNHVAKLKKYVEDGGGLVIGTNSWDVTQRYKSQEDFDSNWPINQIPRASGFTFKWDPSNSHIGDGVHMVDFQSALDSNSKNCW